MTPDAPPNPQEIARAFEMWEEHLGSVPDDPSSGRAVAERLYRDCAATSDAENPHPGLLDFIGGLAEKGSVTNEDRGPVRSFWSYESQPEGADRPVPHRFLARACGESRDLQVLEDTPAGHQLNSYHLDNAFVVDALARHFTFDKTMLASTHGWAWDTLSKHYAQAAETQVVAFVPDITAQSVLGKDEIPKLLQNGNVGHRGVKFAVPLPRHEHLPPDVDAFIANDPVRCQLVMEDYDPAKSPEEFAMRLDAIDIPEDQKETHKQIVDRLSTANSYEELNPATPEAKRQRVRTRSFLPGVNVGHGVVPAPRSGPAGHGAVEAAAPHLAPRPVGIEH
ncbi:hypothetical protein ACFWTC_20385 [Streptomyces sp. NPDC058619]|uniref:hypothetical protein n=1 Tax=unclassified Streptomyces TaxID=2593676 RepID=UPI0036623D98